MNPRGVIQPKQCRYCQTFFMSIGQRQHHEAHAERLCKALKPAAAPATPKGAQS